MKIVFNSSLPRSGSTLLQQVLAQNPRFVCSPTSGLLDLLYAARQSFTTLDEFKAQPKGTFDDAWKGFCRGAIQGFYGVHCPHSDFGDQMVCVDKSRGWMFYYDWVKQFYPEAKVLVCVRDLRAIVASMEKLNRRNSHLHDGGDVPAQMQGVTVHQRMQHWLTNPPLGLAINRLADAIQRGNDRHFHFVVYEKFMEDPKGEMDRVYEYLEEPAFDHDFNHIEQTVRENDAVHGVYGDHDTRQTLSPPPPDYEQILSKPLCDNLIVSAQWFYNKFYPQVLNSGPFNFNNIPLPEAQPNARAVHGPRR